MSEQERAVSTFEIWEVVRFTAGDWPSLIARIAEETYELRGRDPKVIDAWRAILDAIEPLDQKLMLRAEEAEHEQRWDAVKWATLVGFALARTWPDRIEELDGWTERALAYIRQYRGES